ncbi:hypothetical protein [Geoglobus acetivorans]|uniref:Uncharacterized protein n=1 Tax=Geoglobus acetivorans TaxID=565033 RepID=A0ABZ3H1R0_GEOAI|nr:hypothetical protein [Geoglobus acetivorans]
MDGGIRAALAFAVMVVVGALLLLAVRPPFEPFRFTILLAFIIAMILFGVKFGGGD